MGTPKIPDGQPMSRRTEFRRRAAAGLTQPVFRYPFNTKFFASWSNDLAWLTGLVWSDGSLNRNSIEICSKDRDLMEQVALLIGQADGVRPKNGGRAWRVVFTDPGVANFFRGLGLTPAKSLTAPWPAIPDEYSAAFVRGLLDGDGSVQVRNSRPGQQVADITIVWVGAAPNVRRGLCDWLGRHGMRFSDGISHHTVWRVSVKEQASLHVLHHLLYPSPDVPTLRRKRIEYDKWVATPRPRPGRPRK